MWSPKNTAKLIVNPSDNVSFFSHGFRVVGNVITENDIRIEGVIQGDISTTKKVIIGESGQVIGDIKGEEVVILGEVVGKVVGFKTIIVGNKGLLHGSAVTDNLHVEFGADVDGSIVKLNPLPKGLTYELPAETKNNPNPVNRTASKRIGFYHSCYQLIF